MIIKRYLCILFAMLTVLAAAAIGNVFYVDASAESFTVSLAPNVSVDAVNNTGSAVTYRYKLGLSKKGTLTFSSSSFSKKAEYKITSGKKTARNGKLSGLINKSFTLKKGTYYLELTLKKSQYAKGLKYTFKAASEKSTKTTVKLGGKTYRTDAKELDINCLNFSDEELGQLRKFTKVEDLNIKGLRDMSYIKNMRSLKKLRLWNPSCVMLRNTDVLSKFTGLDDITLVQSGISDLSCIKGLKKLSSLKLYEEDFVRDLSPLSGLKELRTLVITGASYNRTDISDISPLCTLNKLEKLNISHTNVTDLSPLYGLDSLKEINIEGLEDRLDIDTSVKVLSSLKKLEKVSADEYTALGTALSDALSSCNVGEDYFLL